MVRIGGERGAWSSVLFVGLATSMIAACSSATHPGHGDLDDTGIDPVRDTAVADTAPIDDGSNLDGDLDSSIDTAPEVEVDTGPIVSETCEQPPSVDGSTGPALSLKDAGLYRDFASKTLKSCWVEFTPKFTLWSDGLEKRRFIWLPVGEKVDVTDMDRWTFPVGTRVFKEFALPGRRVETRLIERTSTGFTMGSYIWNADGTEATYNEGGESLTEVILNPSAPKAEQQFHYVPSNAECHRCHDGEAGKLLGFSAIQLSKPMPGLNLKGLAERGFDPVAWKNDPPKVDKGIDYQVPGTPTEVAAFGALHANCGHCHNTIGEPGGFVSLRLRIAIVAGAAGEFTVSTSDITSTTLGVDMQFPSVTPGYTKRLVLGSLGVSKSGMYFRDSNRGDVAQMPPLASKLPNAALLGSIKGWLEE